MDFLPEKSMINEFNEKEKMRLAGDEDALEELKIAWGKKLNSHDAIID
jgi:hypothetical protein